MSHTNKQPVLAPEHTQIRRGKTTTIKAHRRSVKDITSIKYWIYVWSLGLSYEDFGDAGDIANTKLYRTTYQTFYNKFHPVGVAAYRKKLAKPEKWRPTPLPRLSKLRLAGRVPLPIAAPRTARTLANITC